MPLLKGGSDENAEPEPESQAAKDESVEPEPETPEGVAVASVEPELEKPAAMATPLSGESDEPEFETPSSSTGASDRKVVGSYTDGTPLYQDELASFKGKWRRRSVLVIDHRAYYRSPPLAAAGMTTLPSRGSAVGRFSNLPIKGLTTVAGGVIMHLVLGTLYCWGNFVSYTPENLKYFNGLSAAANGNKPPDTANVMPATIVFQAVGMKIGGMMINKFGIGATAHFGSALMALGVYLSSFQTRLLPFILTYSCITGTGIGTAYNAPLAAGWKFFPKRKGLVNGIVLTGFGAGGLIFNRVGTKFINPSSFNSPYPPEVPAKFGAMLRRLALIYFMQTQLGALVVRGPKSSSPASGAVQEKSAATDSDSVSFKEAITSVKFWKLWMMIVCTATPCLNVANMYKSFSTDYKALNDDAFQSNVGGLGAINNGLGRLFWASMIDIFGFEKPYMCLTVLQAGLMAVLPFCVNSRTAFATAVALIYFTLGGNFAMFPTVNARTFGVANAPEIYSVMFTAFAASGIVGAQFTKALLKSIGWTKVFQCLAAMTLLSLGITAAF